LITVWTHRGIKGWDGTGEPVGSRPVDLFAALAQTYSTDAHFVPYTLVRPNGDPTTPRVNKAAVPELERRGWRLEFHTAVLDIDCPEAHRGDGVASDAWREAQEEIYEDLPAELFEGLGVYHTRGGYRMLWRLPEALDADTYLATVARLRAAVAEHGIVADRLVDWGRCYRLPKVRRDGVMQDYHHDYDSMSAALLRPSMVASNENRGRYDGIADVDAARPPREAPERITENRNTTLTRLAGQWRRSGLGEDEIVRMLEVVNETRCEPPLDSEELAAIARSMMRYAPEAPAEDAPEDAAGGGPLWAPPVLQLGDEVEVADCVARDLEGDGERMVFDRARLWRHIAGVWSEVEPNQVMMQVAAYSGAQVAAGRDRDGEPRFRPLKVSARFTQGVGTLIKGSRTVTNWFDDAPAGLAFSDQFVSIDADGNVTAEPLGAKHRQTAAVSWTWDPGAFPWGFNTMLHDCWRDDPDVDDKVQALREWIGAALLGLTPSYQKAAVFVGEGANGKSTVQDIMTALFPEGTVTSIPPQDMDQEYRRALLAGARLNCVAELPEADILVSGPVKAMVSGDLLTARHIREAPFQFRPRCAHVFSANTLPAVRDMSRGFWRRWMVFSFGRTFAPHEQDRGLAKRLISEELGDIASWCVMGAAELVKRGHYEEPESSVVSLAAWRQEADQVALFLEERTETVTELETSASELYTEYCVWVAESGHRRMSRTKFGQRVKRLGVQSEKTRACRMYGVRIL
jgi:P4 family phage/plasmid primase-like protien